MSTYPRRPGAEASSDAVDVVELLRDPTDQAPKLRHLRVRAHVQLELGGAVRSVLDRLDREDVRLHQPHYTNASALSLRGYLDTLYPSRCYASPR